MGQLRSLIVTVAVVQVRPVRMRVHHGLMLVPVGMPDCGRLAGMLVQVMPVIVAVHVHMRHIFMLMSMLVVVFEEHDKRGDEKCRRAALQG